jgi:hypothetical protein
MTQLSNEELQRVSNMLENFGDFGLKLGSYEDGCLELMKLVVERVQMGEDMHVMNSLKSI